MRQFYHILTFLLLALICNAQTYYVDVIPDSCVCVTSTPTTSNTLTTDWDLDHDGTNDFKISVISYMSDCMHGYDNTSIIAYGNNKIAGDSLPNNAYMLNAGTAIHSQPSWISSANLESFSEFSGWYGYWKDSMFPDTKYIAIKFYSGTTLYYGWMRFTVAAGCAIAQVTVLDYAYDTCPSDCFTSIAEIPKHTGLLYPNPSTGAFELQLDNSTENTELIITDILGKTAFQQKLNPGTTSILADLNKGIYNCAVLHNGMILTTSKLIIQ